MDAHARSRMYRRVVRGPDDTRKTSRVSNSVKKLSRNQLRLAGILRSVPPPFGFLTNHGLALLCIAEDPAIRMREIAAHVQITERAAQRIVADLVGAGYVDRERVGRRNRYTVRVGLPVALPAERDIELNALLNVLLPTGSSVERQHAMPSAAPS